MAEDTTKKAGNYSDLTQKKLSQILGDAALPNQEQEKTASVEEALQAQAEIAAALEEKNKQIYEGINVASTLRIIRTELQELAREFRKQYNNRRPNDRIDLVIADRMINIGTRDILAKFVITLELKQEGTATVLCTVEKNFRTLAQMQHRQEEIMLAAYRELLYNMVGSTVAYSQMIIKINEEKQKHTKGEENQ